MWPYGVPIDQENNFWKLTIVLIGLGFTQIGFTITQNFVARAGRLMLDGSQIGFYSQAVVYLSFAMSTLLLGPCLHSIYNYRAALILFLGGGFRLFWEAVLVPTAMRHDELTNNGKTTELVTDWFLMKDNLDVLLIFSAAFTGLMYGATFLSLMQYLEQASSEKNRSRLN